MEVKDGDVIVAEVAALQLESIKSFRPNAFGMLNITEDHLNRFQYKMENYIAPASAVVVVLPLVPLMHTNFAPLWQ